VRFDSNIFDNDFMEEAIYVESIDDLKLRRVRAVCQMNDPFSVDTPTIAGDRVNYLVRRFSKKGRMPDQIASFNLATGRTLETRAAYPHLFSVAFDGGMLFYSRDLTATTGPANGMATGIFAANPPRFRYRPGG